MNIEKLKKNSFLRNFSLLTIGEIISRAINIFTNIIIARALAPDLYGEYELFLTYLIVFSTISSLGLQHIIIRTISRNQENSKKYFNLSLILRLVGWLFALLAIIIINKLIPLGFTNFVIGALLVSVFFNSFWEACQNVAFGMERMEWTSIVNILISLFLLLTYLIIPKAYLTINVVISVYVVSMFVKDVLYFISLYKSNLITGDFTFDKTELTSLIKSSMPYYILAIFTLFSSQFPILFLEENAGNEEVAFFNIANKLLLPISLLLTTALSALFPNQSKLYMLDKVAFNLKVKRFLVYLCVFGILGASLVSIFRNEIVLVFYGSVYQGVGEVIAFQTWYIVMYSIFCFIGSTYGAANKQKLVAITSIIYAIISVPILWYASFYGAKGLSQGYLIASVVNMTYCYYFLLKTIDFSIKSSFTFIYFTVLFSGFLLTEVVAEYLNFYMRIVVLIAILYAIVVKFKWIKQKLVF